MFLICGTMLRHILVLIIFFNISTFCKCEHIFCYHGESYDILATNISTIHCPSGKCIMFSSACNSYWATTCYNEKRPMSLTAAFRNVRKYFNISSLTNRMFSFCNMSACNYNKLSPFLQPILKTPISFDSLLWPKLEKERPRNTLQNGFKFPSGISVYDKFEFIGQTFNKSKNIWIKYDFAGSNNTIVTYRYDFNLTESFYILRTIVKSSKKNAALQSTLISSTEKRILKYATRPGERLIMTLTKYGIIHEITINMYSISLPADLQSLLLIQYGGNWIMSSAKLLKGRMSNSVTWTKESEYPYSMTPTFDIPKPTIFSCSLNSTKDTVINTTLQYAFIGDKTANSYGTTMSMKYGHTIERTLKQNEIMEYEIRDSLCPNSNLIKIQIEIIQGLNATTNSTYSFTFWKRFGSAWTFLENVKKETEICKINNTLHFESNSFVFLCNNTAVYSTSPYSFLNSYYTFVKANYVVEGIPQKLICNTK